MVFGASIRSEEDFAQACVDQPLIKDSLTKFWKRVNSAADLRGWILGEDYIVSVRAYDNRIRYSFDPLNKKGRIINSYPWIRNMYHGGVDQLKQAIQDSIEELKSTWIETSENIWIDVYNVTEENMITANIKCRGSGISVCDISKADLVRKCRKALRIVNSIPVFVWKCWWSSNVRRISPKKVSFIKSFCRGFDLERWLGTLPEDVKVYNGLLLSFVYQLRQCSLIRYVVVNLLDTLNGKQEPYSKFDFRTGTGHIWFCELLLIKLIDAKVKEICDILNSARSESI